MSDNINIHTPADKLTIGGNIYEAGNARCFKTGDWRSIKPIFISEKCKQCGYAFLYVLMMQFLLMKINKEKILTTTIAKVVEFVQKFALLE